MTQEHLLVQEIRHKGVPLDRSWMKEATYIEMFDISGPKFILKMSDTERLLRDDMNLSPDDELEVVLADPYRRDKMNFTETFTILTMPIDEHDQITFNCIATPVYRLKKRAIQTRHFVRRSMQYVLGELFPGCTLDIDSFALLESYHIPSSVRPSRVVRQIAQETGCQIYYRRGVVVARRLSDMLNTIAPYKYHHNDTSKENQIASYRQENAEYLLEDMVDRNYIGWHIEKGLIRSRVHVDSAPLAYSGVQTQTSLDNLSLAANPVLDMQMQGNGGLVGGDAIDLVWNRNDLENPLDESLPIKVVIGAIAHYESIQKYTCRITGVLPHE